MADAPNNNAPILRGINPNSNWIPNLTDRVDPVVEQAIRYLFKAVYHLRDEASLNPVARKAVADLSKAVALSPTVIQNVNKQLSSGGSHPINVTGLPGVLPTPQPSGPPTVTTLPGPNDPLSQIGNTVIFNGVDYTYTANPTPGGPAFWKQNTSLGQIINDTAANMVNYPASSYALGVQYFQTDTLITYMNQDVGGTKTWLYFNGTQSDVLANIPGTLGLNDTGYLFNGTDYQHVWRWDGTAWHFNVGGSGTTTITQNGLPPFGGVWHACDGTTVNVSQDDGTVLGVLTVNVPNLYIRQ